MHQSFFQSRLGKIVGSFESYRIVYDLWLTTHQFKLPSTDISLNLGIRFAQCAANHCRPEPMIKINCKHYRFCRLNFIESHTDRYLSDKPLHAMITVMSADQQFHYTLSINYIPFIIFATHSASTHHTISFIPYSKL